MPDRAKPGQAMLVPVPKVEGPPDRGLEFEEFVFREKLGRGAEGFQMFRCFGCSRAGP